MKPAIQAIFSIVTFFAAFNAQAYVINDGLNDSNSYWGADSHGYGDVIGDSSYYINSADVKLAGSQLTIKISTNFAGHAGQDAWAEVNGIGYGDVFLGQTWLPFGADAHHQSDNASNGTHWTYGLSLDNRWSNTGGTFTLYELNSSSNLNNVLLSDNFVSCVLVTQCYYRNGQAVAVNTASKTVTNTGKTGTWSVTSNSQLLFSLNVAGTGLANYTDLSMHWGETCQNDVIEGGGHIPEPATTALLGLGLAALVIGRRKRGSAA